MVSTRPDLVKAQIITLTAVEPFKFHCPGSMNLQHILRPGSVRGQYSLKLARDEVAPTNSKSTRSNSNLAWPLILKYKTVRERQAPVRKIQSSGRGYCWSSNPDVRAVQTRKERQWTQSGLVCANVILSRLFFLKWKTWRERQSPVR